MDHCPAWEKFLLTFHASASAAGFTPKSKRCVVAGQTIYPSENFIIIRRRAFELSENPQKKLPQPALIKNFFKKL